MVRMAANNIRPLDFRYDEVVSLTETLRTKGRPTLELELLSLFFKGLWQGRTRYDRAVGYTLLTDGIDKYEAWERCRGDKEYERGLLLRMRGFLPKALEKKRQQFQFERRTAFRAQRFCQGYDLVVTEVERADVVRRHAHHHPQVGGNSDTCYNLIAHNDMQLKDCNFRAAA